MSSQNVETALTHLRAGLVQDNEACPALLGENFAWTDRAQGYVTVQFCDIVSFDSGGGIIAE